jgi:predicted alpha/beta superfamily hydrolase
MTLPPLRSEVSTKPLEIGASHVIGSRVLGEERVLNVVLPPGYAKAPKRRYPVLYVIDGGVEQDLLHVAGVAQLGAVWGRSAEAIVVGIETTDRRKELVGPTHDPDLRKRFPTAGGSAKFRGFIREEVKPFVEGRYRTSGQDAVIGESLAGLFIIEIYMADPGLFDGYGAIDPSLWWDHQALSRAAATALGKRHGAGKLLIAAAKEQLEEPEAYQRLVSAVRNADLKLCLLPRADQTHATIYQQLTPTVLQFLLPPESPAPAEFGFRLPCKDSD